MDPREWKFYFSETPRNARERQFLEILRAAKPIWQELDVENVGTGAWAWDNGTLVTYVELAAHGLQYLTLRVDLDADGIIAGNSDPQIAHAMSPDDPSNVRLTGPIDELAAFARDWYEVQLRRPVEIREWQVDARDLERVRLRHYDYDSRSASWFDRLIPGARPATVRAWVFADTGDALAWKESGVARQGRSGWPIPGTDKAPTSVISVRPDRTKPK